MAFSANVTTALTNDLEVQPLERWCFTNPFGHTLSGSAVTELESWNYNAAEDALCSTLGFQISNANGAYSDETSTTNPFMLGSRVTLELGMRYASGAGTVDEYEYLFRGHIVQARPANREGEPVMSLEADDELSRLREGHFTSAAIATIYSVTGAAMSSIGGGFYDSGHTGWAEALIPIVYHNGVRITSLDEYEVLYGRGQIYIYNPSSYTGTITSDFGYYDTDLNVDTIINNMLTYDRAKGGPAFSGAEISLDSTQVSLNYYYYDPTDGTTFDSLTQMYNDGLIPTNYKVYYDAALDQVRGAYITQASEATWNVKKLATIDTPRSLADVYGRVQVIGKQHKPTNLCSMSCASIKLCDQGSNLPLTYWDGYGDVPLTYITDGNKDTQYVLVREIWRTSASWEYNAEFPALDFVEVDLGKVNNVDKIHLQIGDINGYGPNMRVPMVSIYGSSDDSSSPSNWYVVSPSGYRKDIGANQWLQIDGNDIVMKRLRHVKVRFEHAFAYELDCDSRFNILPLRELRVYSGDEVIGEDGEYPSVAISESSASASRYRPGFQTAATTLSADALSGATVAVVGSVADLSVGEVVRFWNNEESSALSKKEYRAISAISGAQISWAGELINDFTAGQPVNSCYDFYIPNLYNRMLNTYGLRTKVIKDDSRQKIDDCERRAADYLWEYVRSFQAVNMEIIYDPRLRLYDTVYCTDTLTGMDAGLLVTRLSISSNGSVPTMQVTGVNYNFDPTDW